MATFIIHMHARLEVHNYSLTNYLVHLSELSLKTQDTKNNNPA